MGDIKMTEPTGSVQTYPQTGSHEWSEFALLAIEQGGYGDITAVDPYSGRRFWLGADYEGDPPRAIERSPYERLRLLVDAMEHERFLG